MHAHAGRLCARGWMRACERARASAMFVCARMDACVRARVRKCARKYSRLFVSVRASVLACVRASVRPWVSWRPSAHARIGRRLSLSESPFRVVCRIAYQSRCEDLSESLSHPSRCLVQYPSRRHADDRSESPIRLVNPSRRSESSIRVANPSRRSESPIRIATRAAAGERAQGAGEGAGAAHVGIRRRRHSRQV